MTQQTIYVNAFISVSNLNISLPSKKFIKIVEEFSWFYNKNFKSEIGVLLLTCKKFHYLILSYLQKEKKN